MAHQENHSLLHLPSSTTLTSRTLPRQDNHTDLLHPPSSKNHTDLLDVWRPVPPSAIRCCCWWWCSCCDVSGNKWTHQTWQSLSAENNTLHLWGQLWRVTRVTKRAVSIHCNSTHKHKVFNTDRLLSSLWDYYGGCKCKCFWSKWIQPLKYQQFTYVRIKHGIKHGIISSCSFSSLLQGLDVVLGDNILFSVLKQYAKCDVFILQHPSSLVEPKDPDT